MIRFAGLATVALGTALGAALVAGTPAQAGVSEDFAACDGLKKPKNKDDGMRGEATLPAYRWGSGDAAPQGTLAACDRALASGALKPEQALRRAHVLRARAAAKLRLGDAAGALADLDAANAAGAAYRGEFFWDRSMGVSLDLLRAIALRDLGRRDEATALGREAARQRPYALEFQRVATLIEFVEADADRQGGYIWTALGRIDPDTRGAGARASQPADLKALAAAAGTPAITLPEPPAIAELLRAQNDPTALLTGWFSAVTPPLTTAYALAAAGRPAEARAWTGAVDAALTAPGEGLAVLMARTTRSAAFEPLAALVEARIAVAEGRLADAHAAIEGKTYRAGTMATDLWAAYAAANSAAGGTAPALPVLEDARSSAPSLGKLAHTLLVSPESPRAMIDYQKSRPDVLGALVGGVFSMGFSLLGGIERTAGFRSEQQEGGAVLVEYTGNTNSAPVVQEMTLLRAAELAREAGRAHFVVESRRDYQRFMAQTMNGVEMNRTPAGYKTELTVRFLDAPDAAGHALDAVAVIDALGPVYYSKS